MKRSNRLVILVGVLLAVLAFVAIVVLFNQREETTVEQEPTTTTVLVAADEIGIGTEVTADLVEEREIPLDAVLPGALLDPSQLADRSTLFAIASGAQVTEAAFGGGEVRAVDIEGQLLEGEKAIAVQLDSLTGLNFLVQQGDVVDIIMSMDFAVGSTPGSPHLRANDSEVVRTVKAVLQAKRVLYASATNIPPPPAVDEEGNVVEPVPGESPTSIIVIIAGTNADAEVLKFAQRDAAEIGVVSMVLRGSEDLEIEETSGVTLADFFTRYGLVIPTFVEGFDAPDDVTVD